LPARSSRRFSCRARSPLAPGGWSASKGPRRKRAFISRTPTSSSTARKTAAWYLSGVDKLYGIRRSDFVSAGRRGEPTSRERARQFRTI
jgi:hypothetical protein